MATTPQTAAARAAADRAVQRDDLPLRSRKLATQAFPVAVDLDQLVDFNSFDDQVTAPLNGFAGVFDYYNRASSRHFLPTIRTPTRILQARDDPFLFPASLPWPHELGPGVGLELSAHGGHVGFVAGPWPWRPHYWLESRIPEVLAELLEASPPA